MKGCGSVKKKVYVSVESETDSMGIETPLKIKWNDNTKYVVERVIHASKESAALLKYIVLVQGQQKSLFKEKDRWYVESSS